MLPDDNNGNGKRKQTPSQRVTHDHIDLYTTTAFENDKELWYLNQSVFILIVLLAGGDYDDRVEDVGLKTAVALAQRIYNWDIPQGMTTYSTPSTPRQLPAHLL
ncbi:hypothetical protein VNI00_017706 [Paramarasmius palmivorus]|uniref:Uncharacterized protein n=1 Tax=Paramarasmius palmivorus TaxID=297713 RepID=A0AAW0B4I8_9AGAR